MCVYFFFNIPFIRCAHRFLPKFAYDFWNAKRVYACARLAFANAHPPTFLRCVLVRRCSLANIYQRPAPISKNNAPTTDKEWKSRNFNQGEEFWLAAHEKYKNCHWILVLKGFPRSRFSFLKGPISWLKKPPAVDCISSQHLFQKEKPKNVVPSRKSSLKSNAHLRAFLRGTWPLRVSPFDLTPSAKKVKIYASFKEGNEILCFYAKNPPKPYLPLSHDSPPTMRIEVGRDLFAPGRRTKALKVMKTLFDFEWNIGGALILAEAVLPPARSHSNINMAVS
jgi:hypothetical protein